MFQVPKSNFIVKPGLFAHFHFSTIVRAQTWSIWMSDMKNHFHNARMNDAMNHRTLILHQIAELNTIER